MEPYLCFFDVDGTLLFRSRDPMIHPTDLEAIRRLKAAGHKAVINSGRSRAILPKALTGSGLFDGYICGSAYVEWQGKVLHRATVDADTLRAVCRYVAKTDGLRVILEGEKQIYSVNGNVFHPAEDITDRLEEVLRDPDALRVTKVTFSRDIPEAAAAKFPGIRIVHMGSYAEGILRGYDKATGMRLLCEETGIPKERTAAFGDSENDAEMLKFAEKSVLMAHAPASLDAIAVLRVTEPVGGVREGIGKLFFGEENGMA